MKRAVTIIAACLLATAVWAQDTQDAQPGTPAWKKMKMEHAELGHRMGPGGPGFGMPPGPWWKNSEIVQKINLSDAQVQQIEGIFQQDRTTLETAGRALKDAEMALKPMIDAEPLNDAQINAQLDTIAQARMNLEKTHAQMLLAIRHVLTHDQWTALQAIGPPDKAHMFGPRMRKPMLDGEPKPPQEF